MTTVFGRRVIDLSLCLAEDLPCWWPLHMPFQHKVYNWFADDAREPTQLLSRHGPYQTRWVLMDEHTGTHFDAPTHGVPPPDSGLPGAGAWGSVSAEQIPLDQLMGPAVVVDVTDLVGRAKPGESPLIRPDAIDRHEAKHGALVPGDVVLLHSGWDHLYRPGPAGSAYVHDCAVAKASPGWPAPSGETIVALADRGIRCVGTDGVSIGAVHDGGPAHEAGFSRGVVFVEGLCRLAELPARGAWFVFMPVKLRGGTGGPGRAAAFLSDDDEEGVGGA